MRRLTRAFLFLAIILLPLLLMQCSEGGGGGDGGTGVKCAGTSCTTRDDCVNESMCVPRGTLAAEAYVEEWTTDPVDGKDKVNFLSQGDAKLSCHNVAACTADADCPADASGTGLVCQGGFCGLTAPAGPATVTFRGCIDAFGIGDSTDAMRVALYRANQDPTGSSTWDVQASRVDKEVCKYWGSFEFTDVPTNEPLILKAYDEDGLFITTYKYNLVLWSDLAEDDGAGGFVFDTRSEVPDARTGTDLVLDPWRAYAISATTYSVILMAVGISTLPADQGAIAGTIRDCGYHPMSNVRCMVVDKPTALTYFTNSENPRPDRSRDSSNVNGIYAAIGLPAGPHRLSCLAMDASGQQVPLGEYDVEVYPHGATILSFDWYSGL